MYHKEIMETIVSMACESKAEVPVCAAIALDRKIITISCNMVESYNSSMMHAEFIVVTSALKIIGSKYLDNASIYVTLEPCAFCAALLKNVRIKNIFFGAYSFKTGAIFHGCRIFSQPGHVPKNVIGGVQEAKCSTILKRFFGCGGWI